MRATVCRYVAMAATVCGLAAFAILVSTTMIGIAVPYQIVYKQSSPARTEEFSVEVREHGRSHYITPAQKKRLDAARRGTPLAWWGSVAILAVSILVGSAAELMLDDPGIRDEY